MISAEEARKITKQTNIDLKKYIDDFILPKISKEIESEAALGIDALCFDVGEAMKNMITDFPNFAENNEEIANYIEEVIRGSGYKVELVDDDIYIDWKEDKSPNKVVMVGSSIPESDWSVHESHCCVDHGCKYGADDCPVVAKLIIQKYPCEQCK